jgi:hypothetical protein
VTERAMLMHLVEDAERLEPDWADALRRAGFVLGRLGVAEVLRPRRVVALVAVVLLAALAVSAIASERPRRPVYWLFDRSPQTYPTVQRPSVGPWKIRERAQTSAFCCRLEVLRVPIVEGAVAGHRWEMVVYFRERQGGYTRLLFVGLSPGGTPAPYRGTTIPALVGGAETGYKVRWMPGGEDAEDRLFWGDGVYIPGPIRDGGGTGPNWHFGTAAPNVAEIDLENDDGRIVKVPTFEGPSSLPAPTRLWVAALPLTHLVHSIAARDAEGNLLERHELPIAQ